MQYKVGDRVQFTGRGWANNKNNIITIKKVINRTSNDDSQFFIGEFPNGDEEEFYINDFFSVTLLTNNNIMTNLLNKFKLKIKSEPAKTFIKTGITNEQDILTPEGTELFLNWLFEKNKADFAKEVATPLLEEEGKE